MDIRLQRRGCPRPAHLQREGRGDSPRSVAAQRRRGHSGGGLPLRRAARQRRRVCLGGLPGQCYLPVCTSLTYKTFWLTFSITILTNLLPGHFDYWLTWLLTIELTARHLDWLIHSQIHKYLPYLTDLFMSQTEILIRNKIKLEETLFCQTLQYSRRVVTSLELAVGCCADFILRSFKLSLFTSQDNKAQKFKNNTKLSI